jgi:type I restriction enzyme, S subunit
MPRTKPTTDGVTNAAPSKPPMPQGWQWVRFDQIALNIAERVDDPKKAGVDHYVGLEHLDSDSLRIRRWGTPDDVEAQKLRFCKGDIIFGKRRAYQRKVGIAAFDGICSAHAFVVRGNVKHIVPDLLPFFMQTDAFMERAVAISKGSLSPTINWRDLARQEFALPSDPAEQRRIAGLLRAADDAVEAWRGVSDLLEEAMQSIMEDYTQNRFHISEESVRLGDISEVVYGLTVDKRRDAHELNRPYLRVANVQRGFLDLSEIKEIGSDESDVANYSLKTDDILIVEGHADPTEIGRAAIWADEVDDCLHQNHIIRVRPSEALSPAFLLLLLNSERGKRYFRQHAKSTSGLYTINSTVVKRFPIPKADRPLQAKVVAEIDEVASCLRHVTSRAIAVRAIRGQLMLSQLSPPSEAS